MGDLTDDPWLDDERTATLYQVIGSLSGAAGVFEDPAVIRALDLAAYGKTEDGQDVLPFAPEYPSPTLPSRDAVADALGQRYREVVAGSSGKTFEQSGVAYPSAVFDDYADAILALFTAPQPLAKHMPLKSQEK